LLPSHHVPLFALASILVTCACVITRRERQARELQWSTGLSGAFAGNRGKLHAPRCRQQSSRAPEAKTYEVRFYFIFCLLISTMLAMFNALERALAPTGVCSAYPATSDAPSHIASTLTTTSCSKEDEDVLKAEYLKNPKPDKALRLEIVSKVALGEKEVQVRPPILIHVTSVRLLLTCTRSTDLVSK
jgi:hypothetical protein